MTIDKYRRTMIARKAAAAGCSVTESMRRGELEADRRQPSIGLRLYPNYYELPYVAIRDHMRGKLAM